MRKEKEKKGVLPKLVLPNLTSSHFWKQRHEDSRINKKILDFKSAKLLSNIHQMLLSTYHTPIFLIQTTFLYSGSRFTVKVGSAWIGQ